MLKDFEVDMVVFLWFHTDFSYHIGFNFLHLSLKVTYGDAVLFPVLSGKVFLELKAELEEVYKIYCQNHDDAISLLESYEKDENIQRHVMECLERLR